VETSLGPGEHILYKKYAARQVEGDEEDLMLAREEKVLGSSGNPDSPHHCSESPRHEVFSFDWSKV